MRHRTTPDNVKLSNKPATRCAPNAQQKLARGVRLIVAAGRPKPFGVRWQERVFDEAAGTNELKGKSEFFTTATDRDRRALEISQEKRDGNLVTVSRREAEDWRAFSRATAGTPWPEVVAGWQRNREGGGLPLQSPLVKDQVQQHIDRVTRLHAKGEISAGTVSQRTHKLGLFLIAFSERTLDSLKGDEIEKWIDELGYASPASFNSVRKNVRAMLSEAVALDRLRKNPCDAIKPRGDDLHDVGIITPEDCARLFATGHASALYKSMLPRLAAEAFAGLRFASACRLEKKDINREERGILLPAAKLKTKRRHYVDGFPDNLWLWLDLATEATWALDARTYMERKSGLFTLAQVPHPHNCLRHSFATYHAAAFKSPGKLAILLCHQSEKKLWSNYKGNAGEAAGKKWWEIRPPSAA